MTERIPTRVGVVCGVGLALLAAFFSSPAAARKPITGKLSRPGYTVIALAAGGKATSARAKPLRFKVRPPAKVTTLQLRTKRGIYGGPIVIARRRNGTRAIVGVRAGTKLGPLAVKAHSGYAKVKRKLPKASLDAKRWARAKKGVPIGAGKFGRVRSKHTHGGVPGDLDLDGVPDPLDVDDDGDRILDNIDHSPAGRGARAAKGGGCGPGNVYCQPIASSLAPGLGGTVNVNAGSTVEQINATLVSNGALRFSVPGDSGPDFSAELDCGGEPDPDNPDGWIGGLSYCTRGGTGVASAGGAGPPFPECCDPDSDGFGTLPHPSFLAHRATTAQVKTGDLLTLRVPGDGTETQLPATLNFVFVTVPALVSVSDAANPPNSATVSYPITGGDPGTSGQGFPVAGADCPSDAPAACVDGDVVVRLTFWKPQRQAIPGSDPSTADWMDIGHLRYTSYAPAAGHPALGGGCPQNTFSSTDPMTPPSLPLLGTGSLEDLEGDKESSPSNTLTYELDLSQCLAANSLSFTSGQEQMINFMAVSGSTDITEQQGFAFKRK